MPLIHGARWAAITLLVAIFGIGSFARAMADGLNHDEHQFLAPAMLLARHGLLPFRDYPVFHLPALTLIYALLAHFTSHLVFAAKGFSILCSTIAAGVVAWICGRKADGGFHVTGIVSCAFLLCLLFLDPLYEFTTGKMWNHEFPAFCLVVAVVCISEAARGCSPRWLSVMAGAAVGTAISARLTFAPVAIPLAGAFLFFNLRRHDRLWLAGTFASGLIIALLPTLWLWASAPEAFIFDNFQFPRLRLLDPTDLRVQKTMSWWRKLRFFLKEVLRPSWPLFLAYFILGIAPAIEWWRHRSAQLFPAVLVLATLPFLWVGCGAPSRYQYQHFFAIVPLVALGIAYGLEVRPRVRSVPGAAVLAALSVSSFLVTWRTSDPQARAWIAGATRPDNWLPARLHDQAMDIRAHVVTGRILTLAPIFPLEAGLEIYPEFATGPFAWRGASLIEPSRRHRLGFVAPNDLPGFLATAPPAAILTGFEKDALERPFLDYAQQQGFRSIPLNRGRVLWIR